MRIRAPVLALSLAASLALALTAALPAAWAMPTSTGQSGNTSVDVTGNTQGGYTTTVTTTSGNTTTTQSTSSTKGGTTTQSTTTTNNTTGTSHTTTTVTQKDGSQTQTTSTAQNGTTTSSSTVVTDTVDGTAAVQDGSMVILSTSDLAQDQDGMLVQGANVITLPPVTQGESEAQYQQTLTQFLQAHPDDAQEIQSASLAVTTGGTGWVSSVLNQALADVTGNTVLQLGGSNDVDGAQMLVQAANVFASDGLSGLESDLSTLASISGGTGSATDPWAGSGYASNSGGYLAGVSLYQAPSTGTTTNPGAASTGSGVTGSSGGGSSSGGASACPAGDLGTPPNCYTQVVGSTGSSGAQPASPWYAIAVPAWMNSWLNVGQPSLGSGDQSASAADGGGAQGTGTGGSVPSAPAGAETLTGGAAALLSESAQVYGTYTVTTTQAETEYKTVTVPEQETEMVAETQTVPGYWHDVAVTEPGYYSTETVSHPGYYTTETVQHPGYYTTETVEHPAHTGVTYVDGRPHAVYYPAYTTSEQVYHAGYTTTEQVYHPGYTTTEQVWHPATTVTQSEWVAPTTETVMVPQTYTAYVQEQQAYTGQVPVTQTETGWHTVTSSVAAQPVLTSGSAGGQQDTAADTLYVAPVSSQNDPWLE